MQIARRRRIFFGSLPRQTWFSYIADILILKISKMQFRVRCEYELGVNDFLSTKKSKLRVRCITSYVWIYCSSIERNLSVDGSRYQVFLLTPNIYGVMVRNVAGRKIPYLIWRWLLIPLPEGGGLSKELSKDLSKDLNYPDFKTSYLRAQKILFDNFCFKSHLLCQISPLRY